MNDDDLRRILTDATADITPHGTLDDIRAQTTKVDPMARRWFLPSLAAAAAMALVIGGAFWATRDTGQGASNVAAAPSTIEAAVYYAGDAAIGQRLFAEKHTVPVIGPAGESSPDAEVLANLAINGKPDDPDYRSLWPAGIAVRDVGFTGDGTILVSLDKPAVRPQAMTDAQARLAANAVARTLLGVFTDAKGVTFGSNALGLGSETTFTGGNDDEVLALVSISGLTNGATVLPGKLTVTGVAAAFEGNVSWEILVGGDAVIDSGFTTAVEGGVLSPFEFTTNIALEGPGTYTLVVRDTDESGEGRPLNQDSKEIVVE